MTTAGPFLYVAGQKISMYALGSSEPLHSTKANYYVFNAAIALDSHGILCEADGDPSYQAIYAYDARTLKLEGGYVGDGVGPLVAGPSGYVYGTNGGVYTLVYAPSCTHRVGAIQGCECGPLVFDRSGNLYAGSGGIKIYAPTHKTWHMAYVRSIRDGIDGPVALAIGPSAQLFVANSGDSTVRVFPLSGSRPVQTIKDGISSPVALALDSKGRLYVANEPQSAAGWVSVYAPGRTRPIREIGKYPNFFPSALAIDPSDNLYVGIRSAVNVYAPGGTKLLRTITDGVDGTNSLLIASP
jgi:sugar lactone lactonase YvrE